MHSAHDRNLLFGILALQLDFISQQQLVEGMQAWMLNKGTSLGEVFHAKGLVTTQRKGLLDNLVAEHVKQHNNDPERSLAAVGLANSVKEQLDALGDPEISLAAAHLRTNYPVSTPQRKSAHRSASPVAAEANGPVAASPGDLATMPHISREEDLTPIRFSIVRPLAEGGLGIVSVAHDTELSREVALKEIKAAYADHLDSRARFLKEAEITGRLEHPGIVPVYGLGTYPDGRPYYAMRMIKGESLKEAIDDFHAKDSKPWSAGARLMEQRELLRRFLDICNAIEYSHSRGIVHRDLKPANIMLGKYGETLVVDWGLAKSVGETEQQTRADETVIVPELGTESVPTQIGEVVGTIAYMSPEQAAGRQDAISPATDVYALGATLYNLLTGKLSQHGTDAGTLLRNIIHGKFPRPREVKKGIPFALEAICLKAMTTKAADRYPSARALADDIEHYLADEPISAAREPLAQRVQRWFRKHPKITSALPVLIVAAAMITGLLLYGQNSLQRKNNELEIARGLEEKARSVAEEAREEALAAKANAELQRDHANEVSRFISDLFRRPNAAVSGISGKKVTAFEIIKDARERMQDRFDDKPEVKRELLRLLSDTFLALGLNAEATPLIEEAASISQQAVSEDPIPYLQDLDRLATTQQNQGRFEDAIANFKKALDLAIQLKERNPDSELGSMAEGARMATQSNLAACYQMAGDYPNAEKLLLEEIPRVEQSHPETSFAHAIQWQNLAALHRNMGDLISALSDIDKAFEKLAKAVSSEDEPHLKESVGLELATTKGAILREQGRLAEAVELLRKTLQDRQALEGEDHPDSLNTMRNLARTLQEAGELQEAIAMYETAYIGLKKASDKKHFPRLLSDMASCLYNLRRTQEAKENYEEAIPILQAILGERHLATAAAKRDQARVLCDLGDTEAARTLCEEALATLQVLPLGHPDTRAALEQLCHIQLVARDYTSVLATLERWQEALRAKGLLESSEAIRLGLSRISALISLSNMAEAQRAITELETMVAEETLADPEKHRLDFLKQLIQQSSSEGKLTALQVPFMALFRAEAYPAGRQWYAMEACDKLLEWIESHGQPEKVRAKAAKMRDSVRKRMRSG
jgi:serine/threonine protein kinase